MTVDLQGHQESNRDPVIQKNIGSWGGENTISTSGTSSANHGHQQLTSSSSVDGGARNNHIGTLSATPPPGFNPGPGSKASAKGDVTSENIWIPGGDNNNNGTTGASGASGPGDSFTNLANAVGSGLADSIADATNGEHAGGSMLTDSFLKPTENGLSYARHTRHAASRILGGGGGGSVSSKDSFGSGHKLPQAGSLFSQFQTNEKNIGGSKVPSTQGLGRTFQEFTPQANRRDTHSGYHSGSSTPTPNDFSNRLGNYQYQPSGASMDGNNRLPATRDLGMTVVEPTDGFGQQGLTDGNKSAGGGQNDGTYALQQDMKNLWADRGGEIPHQNGGGKGYTNASPPHTNPQHDTVESLHSFTWDVRHHETSRALALLHAAGLQPSDVRGICESYGAVESFRSDFASRGVFFVSYYDMRCAQYAAMDIMKRLQSLGPASDSVVVKFCVPLNSSSQNDESLVVLMDVPANMNVDTLAGMLSSFGAVRSLKNLGGNFGGTSFVVEYHDIQDAKQALLEIESNQPWGPNVSVETGARNPSDRKKGRELLSLIGRWRQSGAKPRGLHPSSGRSTPMEGSSQNISYSHGHHAPRNDNRYDRGGAPETQLVLGPDGRYTYTVVNQNNGHPGYPPQGHHQPHHYGDRNFQTGHGRYVPHVNHSGYYAQQTHHLTSGGSVVSQSSYPDGPANYPSGSRSLPYYTGDGASSAGSRGSHLVSMPHPSSSSAGGERDNRHLVLDLDAVDRGHDARTSLMVRNIPNKYTQQMLLSEFAENEHGPGVIDFFYLPIDFKNRCNRGYAFINFVEYRDILAFHRRYFGKHWRTFNSDKICDITYARIQGKSAMLKRFENSALMEKDDEYKPLVFVSHGQDKGSRLPFPDPTSKSSDSRPSSASRNGR